MIEERSRWLLKQIFWSFSPSNLAKISTRKLVKKKQKQKTTAAVKIQIEIDKDKNRSFSK